MLYKNKKLPTHLFKVRYAGRKKIAEGRTFDMPNFNIEVYGHDFFFFNLKVFL